MTGYLDTSVLLRHIFLGDSSIEHVLACENIVSSELLEIEAMRVIHRYRMEGNIGDEGFITARERLEEIMGTVSLIALSSSVKKRAMDAFPVSIKTLDALHIASLLIFTDVRPEETVLVFSFDSGMNRCAKALGFTVPFSQ